MDNAVINQVVRPLSWLAELEQRPAVAQSFMTPGPRSSS